MLNEIETTLIAWQADRMPRTIADRTRRVYDRMALIYPLSTYFFHSRAHRLALEFAGVRDGMRVLEVATGSGEMFRRLVRANRTGATVGFDLSPNMALRTQHRIRREFPGARATCQAVDARFMPFRDETFDRVFCCYLLELLAAEDIVRALGEIRRVLRYRGKLALVLIGQNTEVFNRLYKIAGGLAPAFWGRQVEHQVPTLIEACSFEIVRDRFIKQAGYPSRVMVARK